MAPIAGRAAKTAPAADPSRLRHRLDAGLAAMGPAIDGAVDAAAREGMVAFLLLLARWNRAYNLTAVRDPLEMVPRHLLDSLAVLPWVTGGQVLDLGTGAGLPGIPLALARPDLGFTLLDSNGKKTRFVSQAITELGLVNAEAVQARAETYRPARKFATIVARAVTSLTALHEACAHLAKDGGHLLALKGRIPRDEMDALTMTLHGAGPSPRGRVHPLQVPFVDGERNLIDIPFDASAHG
jgi:16S rRNA (guanine527-N7)-methyltransferase